MRKPKRSTSQRARDRLRISELYLKGVYQVDIAEELGLCQATVSNDIKALQKGWQESSNNNIDEKKSIELAKVDNLERYYWQAWEDSKEDKYIGSEKVTGKGGDEQKIDKKERSVRKERQVGDPRFLQGVQWCINKRCEILGINAPIKTESKTSGSMNMTFEQFRDQLAEKRAKAEAELRQKENGGAGE